MWLCVNVSPRQASWLEGLGAAQGWGGYLNERKLPVQNLLTVGR